MVCVCLLYFFDLRFLLMLCCACLVICVDCLFPVLILLCDYGFGVWVLGCCLCLSIGACVCWFCVIDLILCSFVACVFCVRCLFCFASVCAVLHWCCFVV